MTLDELILALTIHRDNMGGSTPIQVMTAVGGPKPARNIVHRSAEATMGGFVNTLVLDFNGDRMLTPNHRDIGAREADDLRKLAHATQAFRHAVVEHSRTKSLPWDKNDPDRFKRNMRQVIETGRDICSIISHIEPSAAR